MATAEHEAAAFVETFGTEGGMRAQCSCGWESDPFRSDNPLADILAAGRALDEHRAVREEGGSNDE
jgi:hypothetical protein